MSRKFEMQSSFTAVLFDDWYDIFLDLRRCYYPHFVVIRNESEL